MINEMEDDAIAELSSENICATCSQDCKFDTIDPTKCNAYKQEGEA